MCYYSIRIVYLNVLQLGRGVEDSECCNAPIRYDLILLTYPLCTVLSIEATHYSVAIAVTRLFRYTRSRVMVKKPLGMVKHHTRVQSTDVLQRLSPYIFASCSMHHSLRSHSAAPTHFVPSYLQWW
jgi:hypothetical protein